MAQAGGGYAVAYIGRQRERFPLMVMHWAMRLQTGQAKVDAEADWHFLTEYHNKTAHIYSQMAGWGNGKWHNR